MLFHLSERTGMQTKQPGSRAGSLSNYVLLTPGFKYIYISIQGESNSPHMAT